MGLDFFIDVRGFFFQQLDDRGFFCLFPVVAAEGTLGFGKGSRCAGSFYEHDAHGASNEIVAFFAAVFELHGNKGIRYSEQAESYAAPVIDAVAVGIQRLGIVAVVKDLIQGADGGMDGLGESSGIKLRSIAEFIRDEVVQVDTHEVAGIIGIAAKFAAGVRDFDMVIFVAAQQGIIVEPIDEEGPGVAPVPLGLAVFVEEFSRLDLGPDLLSGRLDIEFQLIFFFLGNGGHEVIPEQDGQVHGGQPFIVLFHMEKFIDIGVVTVQPDQHGTAAAILADDFAGGIEDLQEGDGAGRGTRHIVDLTVLGAQMADVYADTAPIGEDFGDFPIDFEDVFDIVLWRGQYIAVA